MRGYARTLKGTAYYVLARYHRVVGRPGSGLKLSAFEDGKRQGQMMAYAAILAHITGVRVELNNVRVKAIISAMQKSGDIAVIMQRK